MIKTVTLAILAIIVSPLTMQVTNIHLNSQNIYVSQQLSLDSPYLTMKHYQLTQEDISKNKLGFIMNQNQTIRVNFDKLLRIDDMEEIENQTNQLHFQYIDRGDVFVKFVASGQYLSDEIALKQIARLGLSQEQL